MSAPATLWVVVNNAGDVADFLLRKGDGRVLRRHLDRMKPLEAPHAIAGYTLTTPPATGSETRLKQGF